ncbi:hypothetical protein ACFSSA_09385 [Luteolibacter algae]|uniref:Uncharacterized protein n=1 Tax=Luteolibacter algae TaxID=454151 RepID=A0ABW5D726_9BACT
MNNGNTLNFIEKLKYLENLAKVISTGITEAKLSSRITTHQNNSLECGKLTSEHYLNSFKLRCKNPNGIAMGMREILENLSRQDRRLELIIFEFDEGSSLSTWISDENLIIACLFHPKGSDKRIAMNATQKPME